MMSPAATNFEETYHKVKARVNLASQRKPKHRGSTNLPNVFYNTVSVSGEKETPRLQASWLP